LSSKSRVEENKVLVQNAKEEGESRARPHPVRPANAVIEDQLPIILSAKASKEKTNKKNI